MHAAGSGPSAMSACSNGLRSPRDELSANVSEDDLAAEKAATATTEVKVVCWSVACRGAASSSNICRASGSCCRSPSPAHAVGLTGLSKVGENVTQTLDVIPCQWKVIQTMREKFRRRDREKICQPTTPFCAPPPSVSTLADQVGARAVALKPLHDLVTAQA